MITLTKSGNAVVFTFDENGHYLFDGAIEVPVNSLTLITDNSQMATFKKSASNDIFISATYAELGMSKSELESWFKENACGSTGGGGVTSGEVETMIETSLEDYYDIDEVDAALSAKANTATTYTKTEVDNALANKADTSAVTAVNSSLTAHTADTDIHVTSADKTAWNAKSDFSGSYNDLTDKPTIPTVPTSNTAFTNDAGYITSGEAATQIEAATSGKADTSAVTESINAAVSGKADTSSVYTKSEVDTALGGKQATLVSGTNIKTINNESILGSGNIDIQGGGGKAVSGGTNISITTGETADTINCTVPYHKLDNLFNYSIYGNTTNKVDDAEKTLFIGESNEVTGNSASRTYYRNCVIGYNNKINAHINNYLKGYNVVIGDHNTLSGTDLSYSYVIGKNNSGYTSNTLLIGWYNQAYNDYESALGKYNASNTGSTNDDKSLFSVGNGTSVSARHNAFEIRQNGDIYITKDGQDVKLQDQLGGGGGVSESAFTSYSAATDARISEDEEVTAAALNALNDGKQDTLIAGSGITISGNVISAEGGNLVIELTQAEYDALVDKDPNAFYIITDATEINISDYYTSAQTQSAINAAVSGKQDTLIAGSGITISGNVISANGGSSITVDTALDSGSTNPVENRVIYNKFDEVEQVTAAALNDLNEALSGKADSSDVTEAINSAVSGKADTSSVYTKSEVDTALNAKQNTLVSGTNIKTINNESILGSGNIDIQGGGGKAIVAGRGISITTGETADTVSFSLPISAGTGSNSIICGSNDNKASGKYSFAGGEESSATSFWSFAYGAGCKSGNGAWAGGYQSQANGSYSFAIGERTKTSNDSECSIGHYNVTNAGSTNDLKTLFSVGNGTSVSARHNAFEIRQNGDIYCSDGTNDVKLQDTITATAANTTALGGLKLVKLTQSEYDALATKDSNTLFVIVN